MLLYPFALLLPLSNRGRSFYRPIFYRKLLAVSSNDETTDEAGSQSLPPATLDSSILTANPELGLTATLLPEGCILHTIAEGDTPFAVAEQYDANPFALMTINNLDDESASLLQIGDILIVPLEGCEIDPTPTPTFTPTVTFTPSISPTASNTPVISPTPTNTLSPTPTPTVTLVPTSSNAQIEIVEVANAGDVTAEGVRIRNTGNTVDITGWALSDSDGNEYVFTQQLLFSNAEVTIYTRSGTNTPVALFWGLDEPIWGDAGEILTLRDADDNVQASLRLSAPIDLN